MLGPQVWTDLQRNGGRIGAGHCPIPRLHEPRGAQEATRKGRIPAKAGQRNEESRPWAPHSGVPLAGRSRSGSSQHGSREASGKDRQAMSPQGPSGRDASGSNRGNNEAIRNSRARRILGRSSTLRGSSVPPSTPGRGDLTANNRRQAVSKPGLRQRRAFPTAAATSQ